MKTIFETCKPRAEILSGHLKLSDFAARLKDVVDVYENTPSHTNPIYTNPKLFFENTYPTEGLRQLVQAVFGRMSGKDTGTPAIQLETSFGGGKTHDLIALYHLAKCGKTLPEAGKLIDPNLIPDGKIRVAGIVAGDMDAVEGMTHADGSNALTLWGELAYQLKGKEGYALLRDYDERKTPPQDAKLIEFFGSDYTLIMIDEIAKYMRILDDRDYASKIPAFFMSLIGVASACSNVCFVFTLAGSSDAFGPENELIRREVTSVAARECISLTPAQGKEISQIMTHRLFESIDTQAIAEVAQGYDDYYQKEKNRQVDFGHLADKAQEEISNNYPFHPETLRVLNLKVGSLDNFQKTRGALMLLSRVVSNLWAKKEEYPDTFLIHLFHIPFTSDVLELLTARLDKPEMKAPVKADIFAFEKNTHAQQLDQINLGLKQPPLHQWVATGIFMHSLVKSHNRGASLVEINYALAHPPMDAGTIAQAVEKLMEICWHLEPHGDNRFFFQPEPSLNKQIAEEKNKIHDSKVLKDLEIDIEAAFSKGNHFRVFTTLSPAEVDDALDKPKLIVVPPDVFQASHDRDELPPAIYQIYYKTGSHEQPRNHKNMLYFVIADKNNFAKAFELKKEIMALEALHQSEMAYENLTERQKLKLENKLDIAPLNLRINIANAYCYLAYPRDIQQLEITKLALFETLIPKTDVVTSTEEKQRNKELERENREREKHFNASDRQNTIIKTLENIEKVITAQSREVSPKLLKKWLFSTAKKKFNTQEVLAFFASEPSLKLLLERPKVRDSIISGITEGIIHAKKHHIIYYKDEPLPISYFDWEGELEIALPTEFPPPRIHLTPPENLKAREVTQQGFALEWDAVEFAESYTIYLNGDRFKSEIKAPWFQLSGLSAGTQYEVAVESRNKKYQERSETLLVTTAQQNVPSGLACLLVDTQSASLKWNPLEGATHYQVYLNGQRIVEDCTEQSYTLTGLKPDASYSIAVSATIGGQESERSSPLHIQTHPGDLPYFDFATESTFPENALNKLAARMAEEASEDGGIMRISFHFDRFGDMAAIFSFLHVFPPSTFVQMELNMEEGDETNLELKTRKFPIDQLTKLNLKGMIMMLKELGSPELDLTITSHFDTPAPFDTFLKVRQALVSKNVSEMKLSARIKR